MKIKQIIGEILRRQKKQDIHAYLGQKKEWEDWFEGGKII